VLLFNPRCRLDGILFRFYFCLHRLGSSTDQAPGAGPMGKNSDSGQKDGRVHVYIGGWRVVLDEGVFQKRFPEIKLVGVALRGEARLPNAFWLSGER
jgi:hypothetical protein